MQRPSIILICAILQATVCASAPRDSSPAFRVGFDAGVRAAPATGRLVVFLLKDGARVGPNARPVDGPFYDDPQPLYGVDVEALAPGAALDVERGVMGTPAPFDALPDGTYRAQAVLDLERTNSDWSREPGNLYSDVVTFAKHGDGSATIELPLTHVVAEEPLPSVKGVEWFETRSPVLSRFRGRDVPLRAGVLLPEGYDASRKYPAVYVAPGFGDDHRFVLRVQRMGPTSPFGGGIKRSAFIIVIDPESENGHTLLCDSDNNGPCGAALVEELIPALEKRYPLISEASARIITGHSSGGWSTVWLALRYPETFGHAFAGSPDPLDFHALQKIDVYNQPSFYLDAQGHEIPSNERSGVVLMTIRRENEWEDVRGPCNTSGQQWDSWQAVFGPRDADGHPAALFDTGTGVIDRRIAEHYRKYDINRMLSDEPARYAPIFAEHIRIIVGGADEWNLNDAVERVRENLGRIGHPMNGKGSFGSITIVPDTDHGSVIMSPEYRAMGAEMVEVLKQAAHVGP